MSRYFTSILFLLLSYPAFAQDMDDQEEEEPNTPVINVDSFSQIRFGFDISRPVWNYALDTRKCYEFEVDYYYKKEIYFVAEGGWGSASINYPDLEYSSSNSFFRLGINKGMLKRQSSKDWDMGFIGIRYGIAPIQRSLASYTIIDSFWGNTSGVVPAKNLTLHWAEITAGIKVELLKGLFAGWTVRGKFRINKKPFEQELPPSYIAGYGKGEKGSVFDFNFYIDYAIRWNRIENAEKTENINKNIEIIRAQKNKEGTLQEKPKIGDKDGQEIKELGKENRFSPKKE